MKKNSIWLIILEITSERKKQICFLDASKSNECVADFLEDLLPIVANDTWAEKANLKNRCKVKCLDNENLISCGNGHPLLIAHKIENWIVHKDANGRESMEFKSSETQKTLRYVKAKNGDMLFQLP